MDVAWFSNPFKPSRALTRSQTRPSRAKMVQESARILLVWRKSGFKSSNVLLSDWHWQAPALNQQVADSISCFLQYVCQARDGVCWFNFMPSAVCFSSTRWGFNRRLVQGLPGISICLVLLISSSSFFLLFWSDTSYSSSLLLSWFMFASCFLGIFLLLFLPRQISSCYISLSFSSLPGLLLSWFPSLLHYLTWAEYRPKLT